jgi:hypothetical protein
VKASLVYRNEVWLVMHRNSDSSDRETAALQLYMDESGGGDPGTPHAVIGGMLIYRDGYLEFEPAWDEMLKKHCVYGIHMKEFGRHGRLGYLCDGQRYALLADACALIRKYRAVTMAATLSNADYKANIPPEARKNFSVYGMCFNLAIFMNHLLAEMNSHDAQIPIILDTGNPYKHHVIDAHTFMYKEFQRYSYLHLGSLSFDDDEVLGILQAADIIAWGTRRITSGVAFGEAYAPIEELLTMDELHHIAHPWTAETLQELGAALASRIAENAQAKGKKA